MGAKRLREFVDRDAFCRYQISKVRATQAPRFHTPPEELPSHSSCKAYGSLLQFCGCVLPAEPCTNNYDIRYLVQA